MSKSPKTDGVAWMKSHFRTTPPAAIKAFNQANEKRKAQTMATALNPYLSYEPPAPPRLPKIGAKADAITPGVAAHARAGLRNFRSGREAMDALMTLRLAIAKMRGSASDDPAARDYVATRGLKPLMISTTGNPTGAGYLVPDAVTGAILTRWAEVGATQRIASIVPMSAGQASVPIETTQPTVDYVSETDEISESTPAFAALNVHVAKRAVRVRVSNELLADSAIGLLDLLVGSSANALADTMDGETVLGDGTSSYGGVTGLLAKLGAGGVYTPGTGVGKSVWSGFTLAEFAAAMSKVPANYARRTNQWLCSSPFLAIMAAAGPAAMSYDADGTPRFLGHRVVTCEKMPRSTATSQVSALFGDFQSSVLLANRGLTFSTSDLAPGAFENDLITLRACSRYDLVISNMGDGSTAGAVVGLSTAAS